MHRYAHEKEAWVKANPTVDEWYRKLATKAKGTAEFYSSHLWKYWKSLFQLYGNIEERLSGR